MAGLYTPLQLTAISGMLSNQAINTLPTALTTAIAAFNATPLITDFLNAVGYYVSRPWATSSTLLALQSMGNTSCPGLGNSIPAAYTNLTPVTNPSGFSGLVTQTGNSYLGNGDNSKFAQGFNTIQGYLTSTNQLINSSVNAQTYLGPTFKNMDSLTTNGISDVNSNFVGFGIDLANQGKLTNLANINLYGTPAALLQQIATVANLQTGMIQGVQSQLLTAGLTKNNILTLMGYGPTVTENEFNQYQRLAYVAMTRVTGPELQTVLDILDITTPNIKTMADLLDQKKIFPNSYKTLKTPAPGQSIPIFLDDGSVNMNIASLVNAYLPTATGCEDLGKVVGDDQAVANKAVQVSLQQVTGIVNTTLPKLAQTVLGSTRNEWNINKTYLANAVVSRGSPIPAFYRAQKTVPTGIDINNTEYWLPTTLGGLNTMTGLDDIQSLTQPLPASAVSYYQNSLATGSGTNGTITVCDVIGLAINYSNVSSLINNATSVIAALDSISALNTLKGIYVNMLTAANDVAMLGYIAAANTEIANIVTAQPALTTQLNTVIDAIASILSKEKTYQTAAGLNYSDLQPGLQPSVLSFVQSLPRYGLDTQACGAAQFLNSVADTSNVYGQAIVGCMREGQNNVRLGASQLDLNITPSVAPKVMPVPVVAPVNSMDDLPSLSLALDSPSLSTGSETLNTMVLQPPAFPEPDTSLIVQEEFYINSEPGIDIFVRNKRLSSMTQFSSAKTVVYIHGSKIWSENLFDLKLNNFSWMDYIAAQGYDVYSLDIRGYGKSTKPSLLSQTPTGYSAIGDTEQATIDLAAVVEFVRQRRGIQKVIIVGHSAGTGKVLRYTNLYPNNVEKLVLCGASWRNPAIVPNISSIPLYTNLTGQDLKDYVQKGIPIEFKATVMPADYLDAFWASAVASDPSAYQTDPPTIKVPNGWLNDLQRNWTTNGITPLWNCAEIYVPVLVTTGEWDITSPPQWQKNVVAELVNAPWKNYLELAQGSHCMAAELNRMTLFTQVQQF